MSPAALLASSSEMVGEKIAKNSEGPNRLLGPLSGRLTRIATVVRKMGVEITRPKMTDPGCASCLQALREGDTLAVWKLDRLGRSLRHLENGGARPHEPGHWPEGVDWSGCCNRHDHACWQAGVRARLLKVSAHPDLRCGD